MTSQSDNKIYTRQGDSGETSLNNNQRVLKSDPRIEALGALDEINSHLGLALAMLSPKSGVRGAIPTIQHLLLTAGSHLANPTDANSPQSAQFPIGTINALEATIDTWQTELPPLTTFILPGGTPAAAALHLARTTTRRAERRITALTETIEPVILQFLNRLSDFLFVAARYANHEQHVSDITWKK